MSCEKKYRLLGAKLIIFCHYRKKDHWLFGRMAWIP